MIDVRLLVLFSNTQNHLTVCKQMIDVKFLVLFSNAQNHLTVGKQKTDVKLLVLFSNTQNHLTVCKQMSSGSFKNVIYKQFIYLSYSTYMNKQDLTWNWLWGLICHKTRQNKSSFDLVYYQHNMLTISW